MTSLSFGEKLRQWRQLKGVSTWTIEKQLGIAASNLINIEKGRRPASDDVLNKLASLKELDISLDRLKAWQALSEYGLEALRDGLLEAGAGASDLSGGHYLAIKGSVAAGLLTWAEEQDLGKVLWPLEAPPPKGTFVLKVSGDSMVPDYPHGSFIYVKPVKRFRSGKKYVVQDRMGQTTLKIAELQGKTEISLIPLNPKYQPFPIHPDDIHKIWEVVARWVVEE